MASRLETAGFRVLFQPTIEILPLEDFSALDASIELLTLYNGPAFHWIIFTSRNAVSFFFRRLEELRPEQRRGWCFLNRLKVAVIGPGTAEELFTIARRRPDICSKGGMTEQMLEAVLCEDIVGKWFLILRADRGRDVFRLPLFHAGAAEIAEIAAYRSVDLLQPNPFILQELENGQIDYVTVTSSAIARSLSQMFGPLLYRTRLVSISPITSRTLTDLAYPPALEAATATLEGLLDQIIVG